VARYVTTVESAAALNALAPSGATANQLFANLCASASAGYRPRRFTFGVRAGASAPTSQQLTIGIIRTTARGTATTTNAPQPLDPNGPASAITGLDVAWSAVPTVASWNAPYFVEWSFNTQSGGDLPYELLEELFVTKGAGNGLAFINVGNQLPASHLITMTVEHEE
jgi:hypothetical protein